MVFNLRTFSFSESGEDDPTPPKSFSLKELRVATHNFSSNNIVGDEWYGKVYRGRLADGSPVAVKRASFVNRWREEKFEAEVQVGSTISTHPNVLCPRGFCRTKKELLLVYPLMINNTLSYNLRERLLDWTTRKRIALGAARGLAHLHNQGNVKIMHHDICASNILLNVHFEAAIGGFSRAMIVHERNVEEGPIAWPTCIRWGAGVSFSSPVGENSADSGSDSQSHRRYGVFLYGIMLLELISGQSINNLCKLVDNENLILVEWIVDVVNKNELGRVIDPNLQRICVEEEAEQLVRLALSCAHDDPSARPDMSEVVQMLESQFLRWDHSSRSRWSQSEYDSTPCYSFPPSPSPPQGIAP